MSNTGLGRDVSCTTSLRTGRFATGAMLVAEACFRRLTTPRGTLRGGEEEANYGLDLSSLTGGTDAQIQAAMLPGQIRAELSKDERLLTVDVTVLTITEGPAVSFDIAIAGTTAAGPFTLSIRASAVTVELLGIQA